MGGEREREGGWGREGVCMVVNFAYLGTLLSARRLLGDDGRRATVWCYGRMREGTTVGGEAREQVQSPRPMIG